MRLSFEALLFSTALAAGLCAGLAACAPSASPDTKASGADADKVATSEAYSSYAFTSWDKLVDDTSGLQDRLGYNPHDSHYGQIAACEKCHGHAENGASQLWCTSCHVGFELPEGWEAYPVQGEDLPTEE